MLGDSLRRRQGPNKSPRPRKARRPRGGSGWLFDWGWGRWVLTVLGLTAGCFGVGYLLALYVLFPVPAEAAAGVPMPNVVGQTLDEPRVVVEKAGLTVGALDTLNGSQAFSTTPRASSSVCPTTLGMGTPAAASAGTGNSTYSASR